MNITTDQKEAIKVLMNLYNKKHINEEQYFLLLDFVISDTRNEIKISEYPWNVPLDERKLPDMPISVMYGCSPNGVSYGQNTISSITSKKVEEQ